KLVGVLASANSNLSSSLFSHHHSRVRGGDESGLSKELDSEEQEVLRLAAALEKGSEHPLAAAIVEGAAERKLDVPSATDFASHTGRGVTGMVDGKKMALGNKALMDQLDVKLTSLEGE